MDPAYGPRMGAVCTPNPCDVTSRQLVSPELFWTVASRISRQEGYFLPVQVLSIRQLGYHTGSLPNKSFRCIPPLLSWLQGTDQNMYVMSYRSLKGDSAHHNAAVSPYYAQPRTGPHEMHGGK